MLVLLNNFIVLIFAVSTKDPVIAVSSLDQDLCSSSLLKTFYLLKVENMNVIRECLFSMRKKTKTELKFCINALLIDTLKQKLIVKREASERCQTLFTIKQTPLSGRVIRTPRGCIQIQNVIHVIPNTHSKQI